MKLRKTLIAITLAARAWTQTLPPAPPPAPARPIQWNEPPAKARPQVKKSGKTKWIVIGAAAGAAVVGLALAQKRLGNEGVRIFPR